MNNNQLEKLFKECIPTMDQVVGKKVAFIVIPNKSPYLLFLGKNSLNEEIESTRMEVFTLFEANSVSKTKLRLFYPELWLTPKDQQNFQNKLMLSNIEEISIITNSAIMLAGYSRETIYIANL